MEEIVGMKGWWCLFFWGNGVCLGGYSGWCGCDFVGVVVFWVLLGVGGGCVCGEYVGLGSSCFDWLVGGE